MDTINLNEILKSGNIIVLKGGSWSKLIKGIFNKETRNLYLMRTLINLVTLSRYTHSGTLIKRKNKWYIVQSLLHDGVTETELYMPWFEKALNENRLDVFKDSKFNKSNFEKKLKSVIGKPYWKIGILNIGMFNLFGKNKYKKFTDRLFCSHLTTYLHDLKINDEYCLNSPYDIANTNKLERIM